MRAATRRYLLVPAAGAGNGVGHLKRCLRLAQALDGEVTFLTRDMDDGGRVLLGAELHRLKSRSLPKVVREAQDGRRWDLVVVDKRQTSDEEHAALTVLGPCVFIDEGGPAREGAGFLIDTLPGPPKRSPANISSPGLLDLPPRKRRGTGRTRRVLVSFGGEDRENLTGVLVELLVRKGVFPARAITVVEGALFPPRCWPAGINVRAGVGDLRREVWKYDLVFTHFGVTAFESLASGVPVILFHPSAYHRLLGRVAGLPDIGVMRPRTAALLRLLEDPGRLHAPVRAFHQGLAARRTPSLASLLGSLRVTAPGSCPACGRARRAVAARFAERTYWHCRDCGVDYLQDFASREGRYGRDYFFSEYRAQYGRTYLEDFDSIRAASAPRVLTIRRLLAGKTTGAIVDVGCAFGPFLEALRDHGMDGFGIDVSADAVAHVKKVLGLPAWRGPYEAVLRGTLPQRIAAVTFWYVIEHFADAGAALDKSWQLLPEGGVLAFSTPNARGISGLSNRAGFLQASPFDHLTIFSPRGMRSLLARHGFSLRVLRVTGHHPERFPGVLGRLACGCRAVWKALHLASRLLGLGDTFEAYAVTTTQATRKT